MYVCILVCMHLCICGCTNVGMDACIAIKVAGHVSSGEMVMREILCPEPDSGADVEDYELPGDKGYGSGL